MPIRRASPEYREMVKERARRVQEEKKNARWGVFPYTPDQAPRSDRGPTSDPTRGYVVREADEATGRGRHWPYSGVVAVKIFKSLAAADKLSSTMTFGRSTGATPSSGLAAGISLDGLTFEEIRIAPAGSRPHLQVFVRIAGQRFEMVRFEKGGPLEVYDHPKAWTGMPRFVGYAPPHVAGHLEVLATRKLESETFRAYGTWKAPSQAVGKADKTRGAGRSGGRYAVEVRKGGAWVEDAAFPALSEAEYHALALSHRGVASRVVDDKTNTLLEQWDAQPARPSRAGRSGGATQRFTISKSPLKYRHSHPVTRLAIVDPSAPPPDPKEVYFAETTTFEKYDRRTGKLLDKPRVKSRTPGAAPGVVAWLDYHTPYPNTIYIDYTRTRTDVRGGKLASRLVERLVSDHGLAVEYDFGKVVSPHMGRIVKALEARGLRVRAFHDYD